jgi:cystathionine beta-lyase
MTIHFDTPINREGTWAEKYDARQSLFGRPDVQPLWVADMDFATPDFILDAIRSRLSHPIMGYTQVPISVAQCVCDWQYCQHGWLPLANDVVWLGGVVSGLYLSVQAFTHPNDAVMVFTPVYSPFMKAVTDNNRQLIAVPLLNDGTRYQLDFEAIEIAMREYKVKLLLLSNPHNPSGRVWTREELTQLAILCVRYNITVVSDEVWSDIILNQALIHIPFASLSADSAAHTITLNAPSKTFNLAAMHTAYTIISDARLHMIFQQQHAKTRASDASLLGLHALQAAYSIEGKQWLNGLLEYLRTNLALVKSTLTDSTIRVMMPDATYLVWLDFGQHFNTQAELVNWCVQVCGLGMSSGTHFGEAGKGFMRLNMALPQQQLDMALRRLLAS